MCFSAEADLVAGVVVTAVGIDAIQRVRAPKEIPLAALPLLFGLHQLTESFVWWGLAGRVPACVGHGATWLYLVVAFALPLWVPLAVRGVERSRARRTMMALLAGIGFVVSALLLDAVVRGPIEAAVVGHHISYSLHVPGGVGLAALYAIATCGALLVASDRSIRIYGVLNVGAVVLLVWLTVGGLTSLWCVWAAITSVAIDRYLREPRRRADVLVG